MHCPAHFQPPHPDDCWALMRQHPLATLITQGPQGLQVSLLPCELLAPPQHLTLRAHVGKASHAVLENLSHEPHCLLLFQGPNAYVSPGWYPSKATDPRTVPTWNYQAVEVRATVQLHTDPAWLTEHLQGLSQAHEAHRNPAWQLNDAPADYLAAMQKAIVGLELVVEQVQGKFKLSQNRSAPDQAGVVQGLLHDAAHPPQPLHPATLHGHGDCAAVARAMQAIQVPLA